MPNNMPIEGNHPWLDRFFHLKVVKGTYDELCIRWYDEDPQDFTVNWVDVTRIFKGKVEKFSISGRALFIHPDDLSEDDVNVKLKIASSDFDSNSVPYGTYTFTTILNPDSITGTGTGTEEAIGDEVPIAYGVIEYIPVLECK